MALVVGACVFLAWNLNRCYGAYATHKRKLDRLEADHGLPRVEEAPPACCVVCRLLAYVFWPRWGESVPWQHKVFRLAWLALMLIMTAFAVWSLWQ